MNSVIICLLYLWLLPNIECNLEIYLNNCICPFIFVPKQELRTCSSFFVIHLLDTPRTKHPKIFCQNGFDKNHINRLRASQETLNHSAFQDTKIDMSRKLKPYPHILCKLILTEVSPLKKRNRNNVVICIKGKPYEFVIHYPVTIRFNRLT